MTWLASSGKRRATTHTPRTQAIAARDDRELRAGQRGDDGRLDVAEPRAAGHHQDVDRHDPATQLVGRLELDERRAEDRREDVGGAGGREAHEGQRERDRHQPERGDRQAPGRDREEDRPARPADAS